jgi:hypothetical protein
VPDFSACADSGQSRFYMCIGVSSVSHPPLVQRNQVRHGDRVSSAVFLLLTWNVVASTKMLRLPRAGCRSLQSAQRLNTYTDEIAVVLYRFDTLDSKSAV